MTHDIQLIWRDLHHELRRFIYTKVGDESLTDDLLQETFLKIHLAIGSLKDSSKLTAWVYQIARNAITDHFRKAKPHEPITDLAPMAEDAPDYQNLSRCIGSKVSALPEKYRQAIVLTTFGDLPQTELAGYLGISYSGAKSRVQRGREKLTGMVADCELVETDEQGKVISHELDD